ncbi:hypothetical protein DKX38_009489 [Salix brachista]|uniref:MYB-CC type transcription factor LHEQLE-containing domain-containing protein n=1 Tax=Salix brachista TaxID=2182728 RepID=A0A5N5MAU8_9ROSI|nr:hypothetical protein DKX38_009489 [Salix brachista]
MGSRRSDGSNKERRRWTQELHDRFEEAVNQLGGPDSTSSTKGYLEGYLLCQEPFAGGKYERRNISEILPNFIATSGAQLNEALMMQMEVQNRLGDQLEVQTSCLSLQYHHSRLSVMNQNQMPQMPEISRKVSTTLLKFESNQAVSCMLARLWVFSYCKEPVLNG